MADKKKMIFNIVFLILVFAGTLYGVFHGEDLGKIVHIVKTVDPLWLIPGVICVVIFIWGESIIIFYMMHTLGIKLKKWTCFLFSSVGFFFSCITPSATGGQPANTRIRNTILNIIFFLSAILPSPCQLFPFGPKKQILPYMFQPVNDMLQPI